MNNKPQKPSEIKIIFVGMDNAGKSSIILSILREISKITIIKATKGAQRRVYEFLGMKITEWDLGGHEKYRNTYLKDPDLFFDRTDIAIYVIDIQDTRRIAKSLEYLNEIVSKFISLKINPPIYVFFHKGDPDLTEKIDIELKILAQSLEFKIKRFHNYDKFSFYYTSIFDLTTVILAMSEILSIKFPKLNYISDIISKFAKKIQAEGVILIDDNSLIIGSYHTEDSIKQILRLTSPYIIKVNDIFEKKAGMAFQPEDQIIIYKSGSYFYFKKFLLKEGGLPYYIICIKQKSDLNDQMVLDFVNKFKDILYGTN